MSGGAAGTEDVISIARAHPGLSNEEQITINDIIDSYELGTGIRRSCQTAGNAGVDVTITGIKFTGTSGRLRLRNGTMHCVPSLVGRRLTLQEALTQGLKIVGEDGEFIDIQEYKEGLGAPDPQLEFIEIDGGKVRLQRSPLDISAVERSKFRSAVIVPSSLSVDGGKVTIKLNADLAIWVQDTKWTSLGRPIKGFGEIRRVSETGVDYFPVEADPPVEVGSAQVTFRHSGLPEIVLDGIGRPVDGESDSYIPQTALDFINSKLGLSTDRTDVVVGGKDSTGATRALAKHIDPRYMSSALQNLLGLLYTPTEDYITFEDFLQDDQKVLLTDSDASTSSEFLRVLRTAQKFPKGLFNYTEKILGEEGSLVVGIRDLYFDPNPPGAQENPFVVILDLLDPLDPEFDQLRKAILEWSESTPDLGQNPREAYIDLDPTKQLILRNRLRGFIWDSIRRHTTYQEGGVGINGLTRSVDRVRTLAASTVGRNRVFVDGGKLPESFFPKYAMGLFGKEKIPIDALNILLTIGKFDVADLRGIRGDASLKRILAEPIAVPDRLTSYKLGGNLDYELKLNDPHDCMNRFLSDNWTDLVTAGFKELEAEASSSADDLYATLEIDILGISSLDDIDAIFDEWTIGNIDGVDGAADRIAEAKETFRDENASLIAQKDWETLKNKLRKRIFKLQKIDGFNSGLNESSEYLKLRAKAIYLRQFLGEEAALAAVDNSLSKLPVRTKALAVGEDSVLDPSMISTLFLPDQSILSELDELESAVALTEKYKGQPRRGGVIYKLDYYLRNKLNVILEKDFKLPASGEVDQYLGEKAIREYRASLGIGEGLVVDESKSQAELASDHPELIAKIRRGILRRSFKRTNGSLHETVFGKSTLFPGLPIDEFFGPLSEWNTGATDFDKLEGILNSDSSLVDFFEERLSSNPKLTKIYEIQGSGDGRVIKIKYSGDPNLEFNELCFTAIREVFEDEIASTYKDNLDPSTLKGSQFSFEECNRTNNAVGKIVKAQKLVDDELERLTVLIETRKEQSKPLEDELEENEAQQSIYKNSLQKSPKLVKAQSLLRTLRKGVNIKNANGADRIETIPWLEGDTEVQLPQVFLEELQGYQLNFDDYILNKLESDLERPTNSRYPALLDLINIFISPEDAQPSNGVLNAALTPELRARLSNKVLDYYTEQNADIRSKIREIEGSLDSEVKNLQSAREALATEFDKYSRERTGTGLSVTDKTLTYPTIEDTEYGFRAFIQEIKKKGYPRSPIMTNSPPIDVDLERDFDFEDEGDTDTSFQLRVVRMASKETYDGLNAAFYTTMFDDKFFMRKLLYEVPSENTALTYEDVSVRPKDAFFEEGSYKISGNVELDGIKLNDPTQTATSNLLFPTRERLLNGIATGIYEQSGGANADPYMLVRYLDMNARSYVLGVSTDKVSGTLVRHSSLPDVAVPGEAEALAELRESKTNVGFYNRASGISEQNIVDMDGSYLTEEQFCDIGKSMGMVFIEDLKTGEIRPATLADMEGKVAGKDKDLTEGCGLLSAEEGGGECRVEWDGFLNGTKDKPMNIVNSNNVINDFSKFDRTSLIFLTEVRNKALFGNPILENTSGELPVNFTTVNISKKDVDNELAYAAYNLNTKDYIKLYESIKGPLSDYDNLPENVSTTSLSIRTSEAKKLKLFINSIPSLPESRSDPDEIDSNDTYLNKLFPTENVSIDSKLFMDYDPDIYKGFYKKAFTCVEPIANKNINRKYKLLNYTIIGPIIDSNTNLPLSIGSSLLNFNDMDNNLYNNLKNAGIYQKSYNKIVDPDFSNIADIDYTILNKRHNEAAENVNKLQDEFKNYTFAFTPKNLLSVNGEDTHFVSINAVNSKTLSYKNDKRIIMSRMDPIILNEIINKSKNIIKDYYDLIIKFIDISSSLSGDNSDVTNYKAYIESQNNNNVVQELISYLEGEKLTSNYYNQWDLDSINIGQITNISGESVIDNKFRYLQDFVKYVYFSHKGADEFINFCDEYIKSYDNESNKEFFKLPINFNILNGNSKSSEELMDGISKVFETIKSYEPLYNFIISDNRSPLDTSYDNIFIPYEKSLEGEENEGQNKKTIWKEAGCAKRNTDQNKGPTYRIFIDIDKIEELLAEEVSNNASLTYEEYKANVVNNDKLLETFKEVYKTENLIDGLSAVINSPAPGLDVLPDYYLGQLNVFSVNNREYAKILKTFLKIRELDPDNRINEIWSKIYDQIKDFSVVFKKYKEEFIETNNIREGYDDDNNRHFQKIVDELNEAQKQLKTRSDQLQDKYFKNLEDIYGKNNPFNSMKDIYSETNVVYDVKNIMDDLNNLNTDININKNITFYVSETYENTYANVSFTVSVSSILDPEYSKFQEEIVNYYGNRSVNYINITNFDKILDKDKYSEDLIEKAQKWYKKDRPGLPIPVDFNLVKEYTTSEGYIRTPNRVKYPWDLLEERGIHLGKKWTRGGIYDKNIINNDEEFIYFPGCKAELKDLFKNYIELDNDYKALGKIATFDTNWYTYQPKFRNLLNESNSYNKLFLESVCIRKIIHDICYGEGGNPDKAGKLPYNRRWNVTTLKSFIGMIYTEVSRCLSGYDIGSNKMRDMLPLLQYVIIKLNYTLTFTNMPGIGNPDNIATLTGGSVTSENSLLWALSILFETKGAIINYHEYDMITTIPVTDDYFDDLFNSILNSSSDTTNSITTDTHPGEINLDFYKKYKDSINTYTEAFEAFKTSSREEPGDESDDGPTFINIMNDGPPTSTDIKISKDIDSIRNKHDVLLSEYIKNNVKKDMVLDSMREFSNHLIYTEDQLNALNLNENIDKLHNLFNEYIIPKNTNNYEIEDYNDIKDIFTETSSAPYFNTSALEPNKFYDQYLFTIKSDMFSNFTEFKPKNIKYIKRGNGEISNYLSSVSGQLDISNYKGIPILFNDNVDLSFYNNYEYFDNIGSLIEKQEEEGGDSDYTLIKNMIQMKDYIINSFIQNYFTLYCKYTEYNTILYSEFVKNYESGVKKMKEDLKNSGSTYELAIGNTFDPPNNNDLMITGAINEYVALHKFNLPVTIQGFEEDIKQILNDVKACLNNDDTKYINYDRLEIKTHKNVLLILSYWKQQICASDVENKFKEKLLQLINK